MYKCAPGMIDNRMVKDSHQEGIGRVTQRKHEKNDYEGHKGSMSHKHRSDAPFKRGGGSLTPRKA
jgi:hypothetical protein